MTVGSITGKRQRFGWLPAGTRDRKREDDSKTAPVELTEEDLAEIKADSQMRQQIISLERQLAEANAKIKLLEEQLKGQPATEYITAKAFAKLHEVSLSTITRRYDDGKGTLIGKREGWAVYILKDQPFVKHQKRNKKTASQVQ